VGGASGRGGGDGAVDSELVANTNAIPNENPRKEKEMTTISTSAPFNLKKMMRSGRQFASDTCPQDGKT
jgi:hypothetical protein